MNSYVLINEPTLKFNFNLINIIPMKATAIKINVFDPFACCDYWKIKPDETVFPEKFLFIQKTVDTDT